MAARPKLRVLTEAERLDLFAEMLAESGILSGLRLTPVPMPAPLGQGRVRITIEGEAGRVSTATAALYRVIDRAQNGRAPE